MGSNSTIPIVNSLNLHPLDLLGKQKMAQDAIQVIIENWKRLKYHLTQKMLACWRTSGKKVLEEMGRKTKLKCQIILNPEVSTLDDTSDSTLKLP